MGNESESEKIPVTLSLDQGVYSDFQKYAEVKGYGVSKRIEVLMKKDMEVRK